MAVEKATIRCEAIFSDDSEHRYLLSKIWNKTLPQVNVITIAPSADYNVSCDLTTNLITNNLNLMGYGGFTLTNLISKIGVDVKKIKSTTKLWLPDTDKYILEAAQKADTIILAWGSFTNIRKIFIDREKDVMALLNPYQEKIYKITDGKTPKGLHPLTPKIRNNWNLLSLSK